MTTKRLSSKFELLTAFATGKPFTPCGMVVVNAIEREDGSNQRYNVTGISPFGENKTVFIEVE